MKDYYKDYSLADWLNLSKKIKLDIINNYWDSFDSTIGQKTKLAIIEGFLQKHSELSIR